MGPIFSITRFYSVLGELVVAYGRLEEGIKALIGNYAGLPDWKMRAIFGGMSARDIIRITRNLIEGDPGEPKHRDLLEYIFKQFYQIIDVRDVLCHRGAQPMPEPFENPDRLVYRVDNMYGARLVTSVTSGQYEESDILNIIDDCRTMAWMLAFVRGDGQMYLTDRQKQRLQDISPDAWRYKPALPDSKRPRGRKGDR